MVVLIDWATQLHKNQFFQIYNDGGINSSFRYPTIEEVVVINHLIGVVEHRCSGSRVKTYYIDPQLHSDFVLQRGRLSVDGVDRRLGYLR